MAKKNNEAKIKFTAETGEFNKAISKASDELSELKAELKANEAQMKNTGATVEALEKQHSLLENQLKASQSKTEALTQKVAKAVEIYGENSSEVSKLKRQLANAKTAEEQIKTAIAKCNTELEQQADAAKEAESATAQLTDKIEKQQTEVDQLKKDYVEAVLQYGKTSKEAKDLAKQIKNLSGDLADSKGDMDAATRAADKLDKSLDDVGDAARNTEDGFTVAKGAIADLASNAIQAAISKVSEFIGYLMELPEATREIRQDMATLETSFERQGFSTETATNTWKELYKVFGEDDRAVEAANLISKMSKNQEDLSSWVTITKGIWGTYQDSLPVEGLAEASNETAKTGKVTGVLADALNWSSEAATMFADYMSEDVTTAEDAFNEALAECTTEQERQTLITETLTALYGDAAAEYDKASGSQIAAKDATAENILVQNELADTLEPLTTVWQELKNTMLTAFLPAAQSVSDWAIGALEWAKEHPKLMKTLGITLGIVAGALGTMAIAWGVYTAAQWLANTAILGCPLVWIVVAIVAVAAAIAALVVYWDDITAAIARCWEGVKATLGQWGEWINTNVIQPVVNFFKGLWDGISTGAQNAWTWLQNAWNNIANWVNTNVIQPVINFFKGLWDGVKAVWDGICNAVQVAIMFIGSIISAAVQIITLPFRFIWENCKQYVFAAWEWIKNAVSTAINAVKNVITTVMNAIKSFFTTVWNAIKNAVSSAVNAVKSVITNVFNAIKNFITPIMNAIKSAITTAWNAVKTAVTTVVNSIKSAVTTAWNAVKTAVTSVMNGIKSGVTSAWNAIKTGVSNAVNAVKNTVSNVFNGIKSTATSVWNGIKNAITGPIEAAKNKVKSVIDSIKGFFSGLKLKLPNIKLPHFKIEGKLSLSPPSVPKLKIDWYKDGGIMMKPTIFGINGSSLMAGGEAGPEAILPIDRLQGYITGAIEKSMSVVNLDALAAAVEDLASRPVELNVNGRQFALATAGDTDSVNGLRSKLTERGLAL